MKRSTLLRLEKKAEHRRKILIDVFSNFYSTEGMTLEKAIDILSPYYGCIKQDLEYLKMLSRINGWGYDCRSGEETYGYESEEGILIDLMYISDRFASEFRYQWVLDLIGKYKK